MPPQRQFLIANVCLPFILVTIIHLSTVHAWTSCGWDDADHVFTETCRQYCESKRPDGNKGEFQASCEVPIDNPIHVQDRCQASCAKNNCPCTRCPHGRYVNCPAAPTPAPTEPPPRSNDNIMIYIIVGCVFGILLLAACGLGVYCTTKNRRRRMGPVMSQAGQQKYSMYGSYNTGPPPVASGYPTSQTQVQGTSQGQPTNANQNE